MTSSPPIINSALRRVTTTKTDNRDNSARAAGSDGRAAGKATPTRVTSLASVGQRHPTKHAQHQHIAERLARTRALIKRQEVTHITTSFNKSVDKALAQASTRIDNAPLRPTIVSVPKKPFERLHASRHAITVALSHITQTPIESLSFEKKGVLSGSNQAITGLTTQASSAQIANISPRLPPNVFLQLPPAQKIYQQIQKVESDPQHIVRLTPHPPHLPIYSNAKTLENPQNNHLRLKTNLLNHVHPAIYAKTNAPENKQDLNAELTNTLKHNAHLSLHKKELYKAQHLDTHLKANLKNLSIAYRAHARKLAVDQHRSLSREHAQIAQLDAPVSAKKEAIIRTQRHTNGIGSTQKHAIDNSMANLGTDTKLIDVNAVLPHANRVRQGAFLMVSQRGSLKSLGINETALAKIKLPGLAEDIGLNRGTIDTIRTKLYHQGKLQTITFSKTTKNIASALPTAPFLTTPSPTTMTAATA